MNKERESGPAAIGIVGLHNSGKTTLIEKLIPLLMSRGYRIGTLKHTCHESFEVDTPGKDTFRHRQAGAETVAISSAAKTVFIKELKGELALEMLLRQFNCEDLVIVEGYKGAGIPKILVHREGFKSYPLAADPDILAIYSETPFDSKTPIFSSGKIDELALLIEKEILKARCPKESTI